MVREKERQIDKQIDRQLVRYRDRQIENYLFIFTSLKSYNNLKWLNDKSALVSLTFRLLAMSTAIDYGASNHGFISYCTSIATTKPGRTADKHVLVNI